LEEIVHFIALDSPNHADLTAKRIIKRIERLKLFPLSGRMVPEAREKTYREVVVGSYRVLYRLIATECRILTIVHSKRDLTTKLGEI
jgi:toxin ParE1/3/4